MAYRDLQKKKEYRRRWYKENRERCNGYRSRHRELNREQINERQRINYHKNRDDRLAKKKKRREANPEKSRALNHKYKLNQYGMTVEEFDSMLKSQNDGCAICKRHASAFKQKLNVDHCHRTEKVRGLLCHDCNLLIGHAKELKQTLKNAINYLSSHENWAIYHGGFQN